jgi:hypothetical protein
MNYNEILIGKARITDIHHMREYQKIIWPKQNYRFILSPFGSHTYNLPGILQQCAAPIPWAV